MQVATLIPLDTVAVATLDAERRSATLKYAGGVDAGEIQKNVTAELSAEALEAVANPLGGTALASASSEEFVEKFGEWTWAAPSGVCSLMAVPLISDDTVFAALILSSKRPDLYEESHLPLLRRVGAQIAGPVASTIATARLRRRAREEAVLAAIGRAVNSGPDIEGAFEVIAGRTASLFSFDRAVMAFLDERRRRATTAYVSGPHVPGRGMGANFELTDEALSAIADAGTGVVISSGSPEEFAKEFAGWAFVLSAPACSMIAVPLVSAGKVFAVLLLSSGSTEAYSDRELAFTKRIASQIAGAFVTGHRSAELSQRVIEFEVVEAVGRSLAVAPTVEAAYLGAAEQIRKLVKFDRLAFSALDRDGGTMMHTHVSGRGGTDGDIGVTQALAGTMAEEAISSGRSFILQGVSPGEIAVRFPSLTESVEVGLQSFVEVPLFVTGEAVGSIGLASAEANAYKTEDLEAVEDIGVQVAGMVASARLEELHRRKTREMAALAEIARTITSSVDILEVYDLVAEQIRALIPFDRIAIWTVDLRGESMVPAYTAGVDVPGIDESRALQLASMAARSPGSGRAGGATGKGGVLGELASRLAKLARGMGGGLQSFLVAPLALRGETVGLLSLRSKTPNAYSQRDVALAERIGTQIGGAAVNGQVYLESRQVEEAVRDVVYRLDLAVQGSGDGLWDWKILEDEVWWSSRYKELVGYRDNENGSQDSWLSRLHPDDRDRVVKALNDHVTLREPYRVDYRLRTSSGEYRWFSDRAEAVWDEAEGKAVRMAGSLRPITDEAGAASLPVPYDLARPALAIESFKSALLAAGRDGTDYAARIASAGQPLRRLMSGLEEMSWAISAELNPGQVDLSALARSVVAKLRKTGRGRKVTVSIAGGMTADGDEALLRMLVEKLLQNSWTFTTGREQARIEFGSEERDGATAYRVRDNGVGFDIEDAERLFGLFQRLHPSGEPDGAGLGLAVAQHIVGRHGGRIWAEAEVDVGATFYFTL